MDDLNKWLTEFENEATEKDRVLEISDQISNLSQKEIDKASIALFQGIVTWCYRIVFEDDPELYEACATMVEGNHELRHRLSCEILKACGRDQVPVKVIRVMGKRGDLTLERNPEGEEEQKEEEYRSYVNQEYREILLDKINLGAEREIEAVAFEYLHGKG